MRLVQFVDRDETRKVAAVSDDGNKLRVLRQAQRVYDLALEAGRRKLALATLVQDRLGTEAVSYDEESLKKESQAFESLRPSTDLVGLEQAFKFATEEFRPGQGPEEK